MCSAMLCKQSKTPTQGHTAVEMESGELMTITGDTFQHPRLPRERIVVRVGQLIHFTSNSRHFSKYSLGVITRCSLGKNSIGVIPLDALAEGRWGAELSLPRFQWKLEDDDLLKYRVWQWPVELPFGVTVHKSQGATLNRVVMWNDVQTNFSPHGLCYVSLSRVRTAADVRIFGSTKMNCRVLAEFDVVESEGVGESSAEQKDGL